MGRRLQQAVAPAPAVLAVVGGQGEDSVDVLYTMVALTGAGNWPTMGSALAIYTAEVEADLLAQGWQVRHTANAAKSSRTTWPASQAVILIELVGNLQAAVFGMQCMLAEGALNITSRLNIEQMAAARIALTVSCIIQTCCFGLCLSKHLLPKTTDVWAFVAAF